MTLITRWDPFRELNTITDRMNRLFQDTYGTQGREEGLTSSFVPAVDIYEDEHNVTVKMEVPGIDQKDIDVRLENNTLTVRGEVEGLELLGVVEVLAHGIGQGARLLEPLQIQPIRPPVPVAPRGKRRRSRGWDYWVLAFRHVGPFLRDTRSSGPRTQLPLRRSHNPRRP